jgi:crotonobetainyl-CoA:carnitine CoA-transferase CaiB-like acyl-CoA transferase
MADELLLSGLVVVDMSQFLSGPYCSLRLPTSAPGHQIERPDGGDLSRALPQRHRDRRRSTIFHAINRGRKASPSTSRTRPT